MTAKQAELAARYGIDALYPEDATYPPRQLFSDRAFKVFLLLLTAGPPTLFCGYLTGFGKARER